MRAGCNTVREPPQGDRLFSKSVWHCLTVCGQAVRLLQRRGLVADFKTVAPGSYLERGEHPEYGLRLPGDVGRRVAIVWHLQSRDCHRLPLSAKALSPSAKTCHDLPRADSFSSDPWRSTGPLRNSVFKGRVGIVLMGLELWRTDVSQQSGMRLVASDLLVENQVEDPPGPVTVCQIETGGWGRQPLARATGPWSSPIPSLAKKLHLGRKLLISNDASGVDEELGHDPGANA